MSPRPAWRQRGRMLRELAHFVRFAPRAALLKQRLDGATHLDVVEAALDGEGKARWRAALVVDLAGEVLEIGAGSGAMFRHYPGGVRVTALEPDEALLQLAAARAREAPVPVEVQAGVGEELPFGDARFDAVVAVSVLCCVSSVEQTLREVRRVLRPGGSLRLIEHVKSDRTVPGALQELLNPLWRAVNGQGCNMNRDPRPVLRALGFIIRDVEPFQLFAPEMPAAFENLLIRATRP
jgi:ubiquinone/menaquinone biosynthesis C-methylase UbiE